MDSVSSAVPAIAPGLQALANLFDRGGPIVWLLFALACIAMAIVIIKVWQFRAARFGRASRVEPALAAWQAGEHAKSIDLLDGAREPIARSALAAMRGLQTGVSESLAREEAIRTANADISDLRRYLRPLELIGAICPLLGLLGTVIGMIAAFQSIETAGTQVDPALLSGGIWQALLTTAVGLSVAIPISMAHSWLDGRVERLTQQMEDTLSRVFTARLEQSRLSKSI